MTTLKVNTEENKRCGGTKILNLLQILSVGLSVFYVGACLWGKSFDLQFLALGFYFQLLFGLALSSRILQNLSLGEEGIRITWVISFGLNAVSYSYFILHSTGAFLR